MIVISGALVLVALLLLVLGLTMQELNFVYGSIAVSLASFVFLVIGILQRRGEPAAAGAGSGAPQVREGDAPAPAAPAGAPVPVLDGPSADADGEHSGDEPDEPSASGLTVLVVPGRPRYHVEGCRYLAGKAAEELDVDEAREQYTPCGVCKPEATLAARAAASQDEPAPADEPSGEVVDSGVPGAEDAAADLEADLDPEPAPPARRRGGSRRVGAASRTAAAAGGTDRAPDDDVPGDGGTTDGLRTAPVRAPAPARRARKAAPAAKVVAPAPPDVVGESAGAATAALPVVPSAPVKAPARRGKVVVIPDRARFHTQDCRFVRGALGATELTRTQAAKQGYQPCGVCRP